MTLRIEKKVLLRRRGKANAVNKITPFRAGVGAHIRLDITMDEAEFVARLNRQDHLLRIESDTKVANGQ